MKTDEMTEIEAKKLLTDIANTLGIGSLVRTSGVILANIENASRRSSCLGKIESYLTEIKVDDDGEKYEDSLLNWGENPEQYIKTFKAAIASQ